MLVAIVATSCAGGRAGTPTARIDIPGPAASGQPNIVFVLTDDLSTDLLPYLPHVRQLRRDGATFTNYVVPDSLCCPSRATIFTGKYPHNTGILTNRGKHGGFWGFHDRGEEKQTFATALDDAGYSTAMLGKYLNRYEPAQPVDGHENYIPPGWDAWRVAGFDGYRQHDYELATNGGGHWYGDGRRDYLGSVLSDDAVGFVRRSAVTRRPFMIEIGSFSPHLPSTPAPRDLNKLPGIRAPRDASFGRIPTDGPTWVKPYGSLTTNQVDEIDAAFRRRVLSMLSVDRMIGRLRHELRQLGVTNNTYIVFSSDNGYHLGQHGLMGGKQTAFETDINVPLIIAGPGIRPGTTIDELASTIDLLPTFARLGGARVPPGVDGRSLVPLLRGQPVHEWRKAVLVEHTGPVRSRDDPDYQDTGSGDPPSYHAIRTKTETYVEYVNGDREYYDNATDPLQLHNRIDSISPVRRAQLSAALTKLARCKGTVSCGLAAQVPTPIG